MAFETNHCFIEKQEKAYIRFAKRYFTQKLRFHPFTIEGSADDFRYTALPWSLPAAIDFQWHYGESSGAHTLKTPASTVSSKCSENTMPLTPYHSGNMKIWCNNIQTPQFHSLAFGSISSVWLGWREMPVMACTFSVSCFILIVFCFPTFFVASWLSSVSPQIQICCLVWFSFEICLLCSTL